MNSSLKLWLFPKAVGTALTQNVLVPSQLNNPEALSNILSTSVVGKIHFMNDLNKFASLPAYKDNAPHFNVPRTLDILGLKWLIRYSTNAASWQIGSLPDGFISALAEDGNENLSPQIAQTLQHFHVPFDVVKIANKEYGIIFGEGISIDDPAERKDYLKRDMETLIRTVSTDMSQKEILHEVVFDVLINLNV